ncbi:unnamed protein product [Ceutorhynchus assimilis]|uniref:Proton channel OtopLc-like n=1 Tax=Ceutorhynchus assimilis TaxID=467358 RepID=A0A9P0GJH4_9CUCU|nr:unnamed protein product [Ceutorhynchus assimilis]
MILGENIPQLIFQLATAQQCKYFTFRFNISDIIIFQDPRSMILPIVQGSRPRSLYNSTNSYDDQIHYNSLNHSNSTLTAQEQFAPYFSLESGVVYPNGPYQIRDFTESRRPMTPLTSSSSHHKLPTTPEAKKKMFTDILFLSGSTIYAILIVTLGVSFYVIDSFELDEKDFVDYLAEGFSLILLGLALSYLLYLNVDIALYNGKKKRFEKLMEDIQPEHMEFKETDEGVIYDETLQEALALRNQLDHKYCFNQDRHSSNFYLKIGAAGFCFGHLIHSFLILTYRGVILSSDLEKHSECNSVLTFIIEILYPIYSITLLFFIFKYSNVIINKNKALHRFGFMHCLASSLCFWLWTIFRETAEYIQNSKYYKGESGNKTTIGSDSTETYIDYSKVSVITPRRFTAICEHDEMNVIYQNYSPYLYPFSVEYSILVAGIIYIVWINIGLCTPEDKSHHHGEDTRECRNDRRASEPESNVTIHADCHASNKGLFSGFIVLVFAFVSVILFFVTYYNNSTELAEIGLTINQSTKAAIMFCMILAVVFAYFQMIKLDVNEMAHNSLDNFLCLICLPAFFVYGLFSLLPGVIFGNVLAVVVVLFELIQVLIQTPFIIDGMARSSNSKVLRKKKPGREFVTFLVICNVAMWVMQTFEVKSHGLDQYRQEFYSKELWSIVGHMCLPLMMFYRFHSSVCIGDIWKFAYMPSGH